MPLKIGDPAPHFELPAIAGETHITVSSRGYLGKLNLVVTFHPLDWTPTWAVQVPELDARSKEFAALNAQVLDISVDSISSHVAWRNQEVGAVKIPLCADFFPHGAVAKQFGILRDEPPVPGISERAAFIVDKEGWIAFARVYPLDQLPDVQELLEELRKLQ